MHPQFIADAERLPVGDALKLETALKELFTRFSPEGPLGVRAARDRFSAVLSDVRAGAVHLVEGRTDDEPAVIASVREIATLIRAAAGQLSVVEALNATGFRPARTALHYEQASDDSSSEFGLVGRRDYEDLKRAAG